MGKKLRDARTSPAGFISGSDCGLVEGTTTYKQSYPHGGANPTSRPFPGNGGGPALVVPDGKPAGQASTEVGGKNDVTHILATKRTFPDRIYHPSDAVVPKGSAVPLDFSTNYCALGKTIPAGHADAVSAGKPCEYFTSGGILGFTNTGKPLLDKQPSSSAHDYAQGTVILPDGSKPSFSTSHGAAYSARDSRDVQKALSARSAGRTIRESDIVSKEALHGAHPDVRAREGKKLQTCLAPDGSAMYDVTTNKACMANEEALKKSCTRTVQKVRNTDGFSLRVEHERRWRKKLLGGNSEKAASTVSSALPAGFQSTKFNERSQRAAKYGARMQPLFEDDVKLTRPLGKQDIVVPDPEGKLGCFETTTGTAHCDPYKRMRAARGISEATVASAFSVGGGSQAPAPQEDSVDQFLRSEASVATGFSASLM
eukprot:gnl/MRDRNA2_/MRDRNA2_105841_c0_seq1.p1 gnl/MRDRNA2_/MRDRNA2_105841_c0~~gnl/MRDRNA2_/MRDRNA2_105841_c0_seq1.p1  ORF type:complete len:427 (-),score=85.25 gnl/MRDRNA2_/MRDRNA2_105841_c0_seq1:165-1445(-)